MLALDLDHLDRYSDVLRIGGGAAVTVRFAEPADAAALQAYFRSLSMVSRYARLMGAASELPAGQLDAFTHLHDDGRFSVVATIDVEGRETIVGEARYAFDADSASFELGLSVADAFHGQGFGAALMSNMECRAAALGADRMFGDTLRSNEAMLALARKSGFAFAPAPNDWKQMRFTKQIDVAAKMPCATWRLAEAALAAGVRNTRRCRPREGGGPVTSEFMLLDTGNRFHIATMVFMGPRLRGDDSLNRPVTPMA